MENNNLITREYFNNEYLSEVTMIQDDEKKVWFKILVFPEVCWKKLTQFSTISHQFQVLETSFNETKYGYETVAKVVKGLVRRFPRSVAL